MSYTHIEFVWVSPQLRVERPGGLAVTLNVKYNYSDVFTIVKNTPTSIGRDFGVIKYRVYNGDTASNIATATVHFNVDYSMLPQSGSSVLNIDQVATYALSPHVSVNAATDRIIITDFDESKGEVLHENSLIPKGYVMMRQDIIDLRYRHLGGSGTPWNIIHYKAANDRETEASTSTITINAEQASLLSFFKIAGNVTYYAQGPDNIFVRDYAFKLTGAPPDALVEFDVEIDISANAWVIGAISPHANVSDNDNDFEYNNNTTVTLGFFANANGEVIINFDSQHAQQTINDITGTVTFTIKKVNNDVVSLDPQVIVYDVMPIDPMA